MRLWPASPRQTLILLLAVIAELGLRAQCAYAAAGRTPGTFQVSATGSAQYTIPIWAPPGPHGIQPAISLFYDSRSGIGPLGIGWSIGGLGSITRCNKTYAQDGAAAPVALQVSDGYCINGNRLRLTSAADTYGEDGSTYETEIFDRTQITASGTQGNGPAYFIVQGPDGTKYYYGFVDSNGNGASSQVLADGTQTVLTWLLSKVVDTAGNNYVINYTTSNTVGTAVPAEILWTPTSTGAATYQYEMLFNYNESSTNVPQSSLDRYVAGTHVSDGQLLTSIEILASGAVVKDYFLAYQSSPTTARKELTSVQECADSAQSNCLSPSTFTYGSPAQGVSTTSTTALSSSGAYLTARYDLNGDGYPDLVYEAPDSSAWYVAFGSASGYGSPVNIGINANVNGNVLIGKLAGTSQDEVLADNNGTWYYYYWNGSSFTSASTGIAYDTSSSESGYELADIDGDGRPDLIELTQTVVQTIRGGTSVTAAVLVNMNTSSGGSVSFNSTALTAYSSSNLVAAWLVTPDGQYGRLRHFDFNGDGRDDLALVTVTGNSADYTEETSELISTGSAFTGSQIATESLDAPGTPVPVYFGNWNDDSCTDFVNQNVLYISGCNGTAPQTFTLADNVVGALDWDGDGRSDLLVQDGSYLGVYLSTGSGISALQSTSIPYSSNCVYLTMDTTGSGMDDLGCWEQSGAGPVTYYLHNGTPDLATKFEDGYGNYAEPQYVPLPQTVNSHYFEWSNASGADQSYMGPMYLVSQVNYNDPSGQTEGYNQQHAYAGALINIQGRGFDGFGAHQVEDSRNNVYTTWDYGLAFPYTGMLEGEFATIDNSSSQQLFNLSSTQQTIAISSASNEEVDFPYLQSTTLKQYELGASGAATRLVTTTAASYTYDNYGNVTTSTETLTDNDSGSPYNGDSWTTTTTNTPDVDTSQWCLNLLTQTQVNYTSTDTKVNQTGVTRTKQFTPDTTNCRYNQMVTEPSSSAYKLTETLGYDSFGNISSDQVAGAGLTTRSTQINWGTTGQLPMSVTDPSGALMQLNYDFRFGFLSSITDANGLTTSRTADAFGRKATQTNPDGTSTSWQYNSCTENSACPELAQMQTIATQLDEHGNYIRDVQTYSDAADRVIEQLSRNQNPGSGAATYTYQSSQYDSLGRLIAQSVPVLESASGGAPEITYSYDVLNRVLSKQQPINGTTATTNYAYAGRTTTITDANGHTRTLVQDVNGWLRETQDATGYAIILGYDAAGSKNLVTDNLGNTLWSANYQYGIAPFMTSSSDTDLGSWSYGYDALGELTGWTDAKGQSFSMTYDVLSRPLTRQEPDLFTQWTYGSSAAAHEIGKLKSVCTGTGANPTACNGDGYAESETYDSFGRLASRAIEIPGDATYTYDFAYSPTTGLPSTLTYPAISSGFQLQLQYGYTNGLLTSISDVADSPNVTLWSTSSVDGFGHYLQETLGNGVQVAHQYDPGSGLVSSITAGLNGGSALQNNSYLYDAVGNLIEREDNNQGLTENIYPDALNRFDHSTLNGTTNAQNAYDSMGRMSTAVTPSGSATLDYSTQQAGCTYYSNAQLHAPRSATSGSSTVSSCYDANGNMVALEYLGVPLGTISWTSYNQPLTISAGDSSQFSYDDNHQRWQQIWTWNGVQTTTTYIGGLMEKVETSSGTDYRYYVPAGNNLVVYNLSSSTTNQPNYITTDNLGSSAVITDSTGNVVVKENYSAWGWPRGDNWTGSPTSTESETAVGVTPRGFTGQEELPATLAVDMNARIYAGAIGAGMFFSPDPFIPHPTDTRSYNRYAYARYNPTTYTDPMGLDDVLPDCDANPSGDCQVVPPCSYDSSIGMYDCVGEGIPPGQCSLFDSDCYSFSCPAGDYCYDQPASPCANGFPNCPQSPGSPGNSGGGGGGSGPGSGKTTFSPAPHQTPQGNQVPHDQCPHGVGVLIGYGGGGDLGIGAAGLTGTGSVSGGVFYNENRGFSVGASASRGGAAYFLRNVAGSPVQNGQPFSLGAYGGAGLGITLTNAGSIRQTSGPFTTITINVGVGPAKGSIQLSYGGGIEELTISPPIPFISPGIGLSLSKVTTNTVTTRTGC